MPLPLTPQRINDGQRTGHNYENGFDAWLRASTAHQVQRFAKERVHDCVQVRLCAAPGHKSCLTFISCLESPCCRFEVAFLVTDLAGQDTQQVILGLNR